MKGSWKSSWGPQVINFIEEKEIVRHLKKNYLQPVPFSLGQEVHSETFYLWKKEEPEGRSNFLLQSLN